MGHVRLGRLPKTLNWCKVSALLADSPDLVPLIASATVEAAESELKALGNNDSLHYSFWLLTRIATAARGRHFEQDLAALGLDVAPDTSTLRLIVQLTDQVREHTARTGLTNHVDDLATLSLRAALLQTVGTQGQSLFGSSVLDVQQAFRRYSADDHFGALAHTYFGELFARTLRFVIDRDLPNQVGESKRLGNLADTETFRENLTLHARQSAFIMRKFAVDWFGKHNWQSDRRISQEEARGFVGHAVTKLRRELRAGLVPA
jgi:hypothetical protein